MCFIALLTRLTPYHNSPTGTSLAHYHNQTITDASSKNCHVRLFATRTLGLQNLPNRDEVPLTSPPASPVRNGFSPTRNGFPSPTRAVSPSARATPGPPLPPRRHATGGGSVGDRSAFPPSPGPPMLRPTRALSPVRNAASRSPALEDVPDETALESEPAESQEEVVPEPTTPAAPTAHTGRGQGGLPRTVPLSPLKSRFGEDTPDTPDATITPPPPLANGRTRSLDATPHMTGTVRLTPSATGTRYGRALAPTPTGTPRQWGLGGTNPACGRCGKTVYFAEQVKAIGKTYHKGCLKCSECNTTLDSTRLTERDGEPYCRRCYSKVRSCMSFVSV